MRAVVYDKYGPPEVLRVENVERPVPKADEVLVRVHATTVNRTDAAFRGAETFLVRFFTGLLRPKQPIAGRELAGVVEAHRYVDTQQKTGNVVLTLDGGGAR